MTSNLPAWAGSVDADPLARLLALYSEQDWLDYKRQCDISSTRGLVEFAKDAGAMMITGGYILVGADDNGQPTGDVEHPGLFDPATLHAKLAKYLPKPFEIRSASHSYQGQSYALIYVVPHLDGFCVFECDGAYWDGKSQIVIFRAGDVFARHGTRSERWNQRDITMIKQRLQTDADRGRDQQAEASNLLHGIPQQLGGSGLWLGMAVVPEHRLTDVAMINPDTAQQFLQDWQFAQAPIDGFSLGSATYRQPGGVVITNEAANADPPHWWRLALYDAGDAAGAYVLAHQVAANPLTDDKQWYGLPQIISDGQTIPARRDEVEIRLLTLLDILTAHAANVGAGGSALVTAMLLGPHTDAWARIALLSELVDDSGQRQGWHLASTRAQQSVNDELDGKKYARREEFQQRARELLTLIDRYVTASPPDGYSKIREGVTVEILPDEPGHLRMPGSDQEILERCEFLHQVTGNPATLITGDSGMRINAQSRGIDVFMLSADDLLPRYKQQETDPAASTEGVDRRQVPARAETARYTDASTRRPAMP